jgi:taspase (threonine aspartase 1)
MFVYSEPKASVPTYRCHAKQFRTIVSDGAYSFAVTQGLETMLPEAMVCSRAKSEWQKWKARLETPEMSQILLKLDTAPIHNIQDTVGAVTWAHDGGMAAGVSR